MTEIEDGLFVVGDRVELIERRTFPRLGNSYGNITVEPGTEMTITRTYHVASEVVVRGPILRTGGGFTVEASVQGPTTWFQLVDADRPLPRRLGSKPDDTPELTHIAIDDPRIQWLFNDMGAYAEREGYCSQYDALCAKLGIPGRPREFKTGTTINGIYVTAQVKARSQREANEMFKAALIDPDPTLQEEPA